MKTNANQQENIPLSTVSISYGSTATSNNTPAIQNTNTSDNNTPSDESFYSYCFREQFFKTHPINKFDGSLSIAGDMRAFKF